MNPHRAALQRTQWVFTTEQIKTYSGVKLILRHQMILNKYVAGWKDYELMDLGADNAVL
jgi:hypothetical protein